MGRKWFTIAVGLMWLTSMSWLVRTKLLPQMLAGPSPSNATVYTSSLEPDAKLAPIGWELFWGTRSLGWAVSTSRTNVEGFTEIKSHAHFERLPFDEFLPVFLRGVMNAGGARINEVSIEAESRLVIDAQGKLNRMTFVLGNALTEEPIRIDGRVEADKLYISIYSRGRQRTSAWELSADAIVGNDLTPMVRLPNLYVGRTWNVPVYSMFQIGSSSTLEMLRAEVESETLLTWNGVPKRVWLVVLRRDSGSLLGGARTPRGKMWVDVEDGTILQQETMHGGNSKLVFTRTTDERAASIYAKSEKLRNARTQELLDLPPDEIPSQLDDHDASPGRKLPFQVEGQDPHSEGDLWKRAARSFFREPQHPERRHHHPRRDPWAEFDPPQVEEVDEEVPSPEPARKRIEMPE